MVQSQKIDNKEVVAVLNGVIETDRDGEIGYRDAAKGVNNSLLKEQFSKYSQQRTRFITELQTAVANHGTKPQEAGSLAGALHRGWMNLTAAITKHDEHAILAEAEQGEDVAVDTYKKALEKPLPENVHAMLQRQYNELKQAHDHIKALRNSTQK